MLESIVLQGYKSIGEADIALRPINVLIGANGAGKSNFISLFQFMNRIVNRGMQTYVAQAGGADQILHYGRKTTERLSIELWFVKKKNLANGYECTLLPTADDLLVFEDEEVYFHDRSKYDRPYESQRSHQVHNETHLIDWKQMRDGVAHHVLDALNSWQLYHFHDTSASAKVKQTGDIYDNLFWLRPFLAILCCAPRLSTQKNPSGMARAWFRHALWSPRALRRYAALYLPGHALSAAAGATASDHCAG